MPNYKSPENDDLTKDFYKSFSEEKKIPLCNSITKSYRNGKLSTPQK